MYDHLFRTTAVILLLFALLSIPQGLADSSGPVASGDWELREVAPFDWTGWDGDVDGDRIDDLLEGDPLALDGNGDKIGINIHFRYYPTPNDVARVQESLSSLGPGAVFHRVGTSSTAIYLSIPRTLAPDIRSILRQDISMIEYRPVYVNFLDVSSPATRSRGSSIYSPLTASDLGYTGNGIVVAVIDSGVDNTVHESLRGKYVYGVDFTGTTIVQGLDPDDIDGHGTHVAGTVMGTGGNQGIYQGTAPLAQLVDLRYARVQGDFTGAADRALEWVLENHEEYDIRVVSCSWGSTVFTSGKDTTSRLVDQLVEDGVVVVVAAGNDGGQGMPSPASADGALTVGALNDRSSIDRNDDTIEYYSNYGPRSSDGDSDRIDELKPDIVAPGSDIHAPKHNSIADYVDMSGTSMATPHISGIAALMLEADPGLTPEAVKLILRDTAEQMLSPSRTDLDTKYNYRSGWGAVDAYGAVKRAEDLMNFELSVPEQVQLNDATNIELTGPFTKTDHDTQGDQVMMEVRSPGDWGIPTDVSVDPGSSGATYRTQGPILLGTEWVSRAYIDYNTSTEGSMPRLALKVRPLGRTGETRTFNGAVSMNGIEGTVEGVNSTIVYDTSPPDLSITPLAVWISDNRPEGGDRITITARVNNTGSMDVKDALVRFIDGPELTGTVIGEESIDVQSGGFGIAEVIWEANPGIHAITVVADPDDEIDESNEDNNSAERPVSVLGFNPPPVARLEVLPATGTTGTRFTFDGSGSTDTNIRGGAVVSYNYDFGDGVTTGWIDLSEVTHFYSRGGTYTAKLRVRDNGGEESTNTDEVSVNVTEISSDEMDLYFTDDMRLSNDPGPAMPFEVPFATSPGNIGTWETDSIERSLILHSTVRTYLVLSSMDQSQLEIVIRMVTGSGEVSETAVLDHPGGGVNRTMELILSIEELEVKSGTRIAIGVSGDSNTSGVRLWVGEGGSTISFLYYLAMNEAPIIDAGEDKDVKAQTSVTFTGTAVDPDGEVVEVRWDVDSDGEWEIAYGNELSYTYPGYASEGQYTARLEVMDDDGLWSMDTLMVLVRSADYNYPPSVTITCPEGPLKGPVTLSGTASDDDEVDMVEVRLEGELVSTDWELASGEEEWTFQMDTRVYENGKYNVHARAFDGDRYSPTATCEIVVQNPNSPPMMIRVSATPIPLYIDGETPLLLSAEVDDPDLPGDELTVVVDLGPLGGPSQVYLRDDGEQPDPVEDDGEYTIGFIPSFDTAPGVYALMIKVFDRQGSFEQDEVEVELSSVLDLKFSMSDDEVLEGRTVHLELETGPLVSMIEVRFVSEVVKDGGEIELKDDGGNGDRVAGDSIYSADLVILAPPGRYAYTLKVILGNGSELFREEGSIKVISNSDERSGGSVVLPVVLVVLGVIVLAIVAVLLVVLVDRTRMREGGEIYEAIIEEPLPPIPDERPYVVAEVLDQFSVESQMPSVTHSSH
ncbi:MAG: S8 family serine peptidase [Candidatus Thermoplasmatota archaeon]|nr:S8 family serine peptidase [Candidatus Thermoplasmatota archaeon]